MEEIPDRFLFYPIIEVHSIYYSHVPAWAEERALKVGECDKRSVILLMLDNPGAVLNY